MKRAGPNIYKVAELAGVSLATVSRVINPGAKVRDKTREKVVAIRFLVSRNCDALIVHVEKVPDKFLVEHNAKHTPIVVVNRKVRGLPDRCFSLDNEIGGYLAAQSLLRLEHRRIAYISGPIRDMSRMAARWVLKNVYRQGEIASQRVFEPNFVSRDSVSAPT